MRRAAPRSGWLAAVMGSIGFLASAGSAAHAAQTDTPEKAMYLKYCSACHGAGGKGDGVVSGFLRPKPADLTQLAKKAGGKFPFMETLNAIDGTASVRAHGDPDMPVWGELFKEESTVPVARQAEVRGRLMMITDYLRSIQEQ